jgi:hypothetical protein
MRPLPWLLALSLLLLSPAAAFADEYDQEVRALVSDIMKLEHGKGRHKRALESLKTAEILCETGSCSKSVQALLHVAAGTVLAEGYRKHSAAVKRFRSALEIHKKAKLLKGHRGKRARAAFAEAKKALATDVPKPIAVLIAGKGMLEAREVVVDAVPEPLPLVKKRKYELAVQRVGIRRVGTLMNKRNEPRLVSLIQRANRAAGAHAAILGKVKGDSIRLLVIDKTGVVLDTTVPLDFGPVADALRPAIEPLLPASAEPEPEEPAEEEEEEIKDEEPDEEEEQEEEEETGDGDFRQRDWGESFFIVQLAFQLNGRFFNYVESPANTPNLRPYDVFPAFGIGLGGDIYPASRMDIPVLSDIGATVHFMTSPRVTAQSDDGLQFVSSWTGFDVGLKARLPTGDAPLPLVAATGTFGLLSFDFEPAGEGAEALTDQLPAVMYRWLRAGLEARSQIDRFSVTIGGGYIGVLSGGETYDRFRDPSPVGFDIRGAFAVGVVPGLETGVHAEYTRFVYTFSPEPIDAFAASGSLDQYLQLGLGLTYAY